MQKRAYVVVATGTVLGATVTCLLSLAADFSVGVEKYGWFARSGGLVVLAGAVLEYQLWVSNYLRNRREPGQPIRMSELAEANNLPRRDRVLKNVAHTAVGIGTLVWAYGDLLFRLL